MNNRPRTRRLRGAQLIDKSTGKVIKDLTAEDKGRWL